MNYEIELSTVVNDVKVNYREKAIMNVNVSPGTRLARWRRNPLTPPTVVDKQG